MQVFHFAYKNCYTEFAARASKYKNPVREVGVTQVYGLDDPLYAATMSQKLYRLYEYR